MTKDMIQKRQIAIWDRMDAIDETSKKENREFTDAEAKEYEALIRESKALSARAEAMASGKQLEQIRERKSKNAIMREFLQKCVETRSNASTILMNPVSGDAGGDNNADANLEAGGAIPLTINELIDTKVAGIELPGDLRIVTGVTGNEVWPVSINDVEMEEVGETVQLSDQVLDFQKITPTQHRCGLKVPVSNMAIDNAAFDLMAFVQAKFSLALRKYLAKKLYSQADFDGNKGPFSNLSPAGTITIGDGKEYESILAAVAAFSDKGFFEGDVCLVLDRVTEAKLKATPKIAGAAGGFVVENGLCAGYPYVVTHYLNTTLSGNSLVPTAGRSIGIGYFEWFALQQHGDVRMFVDPVTLCDYNITRVVLNTAWSFTDLSKYINGANNVTQAFALYSVANAVSSSRI